MSIPCWNYVGHLMLAVKESPNTSPDPLRVLDLTTGELHASGYESMEEIIEKYRLDRDLIGEFRDGQPFFEPYIRIRCPAMEHVEEFDKNDVPDGATMEYLVEKFAEDHDLPNGTMIRMKRIGSPEESCEIIRETRVEFRVSGRRPS